MLSNSTSATDFNELADQFFSAGWCRFPFDTALMDWVQRVRPHAIATTTSPEFAQWLRYGGTWFAGVNALANDASGSVGGDGCGLSGSAIDFLTCKLGLKVSRDFSWDRGQVSVCYPGYPKPMDGETEGAFRFRVKRDAAHVDGLHPVGPKRRRHLVEPHAFIFGIPLSRADENASPLVVWDGSHEIVRSALRQCYDKVPPDRWCDVDVTREYKAVREKIFETCRRTVVHAKPGECYLLHRLALHGVSPWPTNAHADPEGRMIVYFRPEVTSGDQRGPAAWLLAP